MQAQHIMAVTHIAQRRFPFCWHTMRLSDMWCGLAYCVLHASKMRKCVMLRNHARNIQFYGNIFFIKKKIPSYEIEIFLIMILYGTRNTNGLKGYFSFDMSCKLHVTRKRKQICKLCRVLRVRKPCIEGDSTSFLKPHS